MNFVMKTSVLFRQSTSVIQTLHTRQRANAFFSMPNHLTVHPHKLQHSDGCCSLKILSSKSKSRRGRCSHASNILRFVLPGSTPPPRRPGSLPGPCRPESVNYAKAHSMTQTVFQVNNPKSHETSVFSGPLQGANILESKHSRHAEAQPLNQTKC